MKTDLEQGRIDLTHGAGGRASARLIADVFACAFSNIYLDQGNDGAVLPAPTTGEELVLATDAHVVSPLFFPGGDIGSLAVHGTINDLAMMGARPLYLSASFILEEGFSLATLVRLVDSMANASKSAGVPIVTGDTKVVEQGKGDGVFISTTGLGARPPNRSPGGQRARAGDAILVSGTMGDHGMTILAAREKLGLASAIRSDSAALHHLVDALFQVVPDVHVLRDPTRGGLATTLNEIAAQSGVGMRLDESAIPVHPQVAAACELLGLDPFYLANEGKLIAIVPADQAQAACAALRAHPLGHNAAIIGTVIEDPRHFVQARTIMGGQRLLDWLNGEPLPRIC
jgi:hydrogenase expression/formation protein HypE